MHETLGPHRQGAEATEIAPARVYYLRLGQGGHAAQSCLEAGDIGLAFEQIPHEVCLQGRWNEVRDLFLRLGKTPSAAANHVRELRTFYEGGAEALWVTFAEGRLWWTFAAPGVRWEADLTGRLPRRRSTLMPWRSTDITGRELAIHRLRRKLTSIAGFQGTVCEVAEARYVVDKINGRTEPLVDEAVAARVKLETVTKQLIQELHEREFELLVDLIFAASGWRRVSVLGESEADVDLIVEQSLTRDRAFVQVKSKATPNVFRDYVDRLRMRGANHIVFACHSPSPALAKLETAPQGAVELWFGDALAAKALRAGLLDWLIERTQ